MGFVFLGAFLLSSAGLGQTPIQQEENRVSEAVSTEEREFTSTVTGRTGSDYSLWHWLWQFIVYAAHRARGV